jgi:ABC-type antimicrobial peptide transport system permease subunit
MPNWGDDGFYIEIIGVVGDVKDYGLDSENRPVFYLPFRQIPSSTMNLAVRFEGDPLEQVASVRDAIWDLDKDVPISSIGTLDTRVSDSTSSERFQAILLGSFAGVALILTAVGLYGVLAYLVSQRGKELGIRLALGASGLSVMAEVVRKGVLMTVAGIALGILGGLAVSRLLESLLFETAAADPLTYVFVSLLLLGVALIACMLPAIRAVRIDPVQALKME